MNVRRRIVAVKNLPATLDMKSGRSFYRDLENAMNVERPGIVLDCSNVREMDQQAIYMLLNCLEGAMKRNGDVRLAGVSPEALLNLEQAGVDRLFRIFESVDDAVESFYGHALARPAQMARAEASAA